MTRQELFDRLSMEVATLAQEALETIRDAKAANDLCKAIPMPDKVEKLAAACELMGKGEGLRFAAQRMADVLSEVARG